MLSQLDMFWLQKGNVNSVLLWSRWFLCAMIYVIQTYCQARNIKKGREILHEVKDSSLGAWRGRGHLIPENVLASLPAKKTLESHGIPYPASRGYIFARQLIPRKCSLCSQGRHSYMQTNKDQQIEQLASDFKTVRFQSNGFKTSPHTISSTAAKEKVSGDTILVTDSHTESQLKPKRQYLIIPELSKIDVALWFHNRAASHHVGSLKMTVIKCLARIVHP